MKNSSAETPTAKISNKKWHHQLLLEIVYSNVRIWSDAIETERKLQNGYIADIHFQWLEREWIIEVKTILKFSVFREAVMKYRTQCDYLIIAAPPTELDNVNQRQELSWPETIYDKIGLLEVSQNGLVLRKTPRRLERRTPPTH